MRNRLIALSLLLGSLPAAAQLSINFGIPGGSIGINVPAYPTLQRVPGYPVYYAPGVSSNYFFYDGMYWVYNQDNWYASSWYNGPWGMVDRFDVPVYLLRVPVRYYRHAPLLLPRLASGRGATLGRSLGLVVGTAEERLEHLEPQLRARGGAAAELPATVFRQGVSAAVATGRDPDPQLPLPAERARRAAALRAG
jgi:hypothetical protein